MWVLCGAEAKIGGIQHPWGLGPGGKSWEVPLVRLHKALSEILKYWMEKAFEVKQAFGVWIFFFIFKAESHISYTRFTLTA